MKNYIDLGSCWLGRKKQFVYLDTDEYYGFGPMQFHGVRPKFKSEWIKEGKKYRLILLRVSKKDEPKFIEAMEDLKIKMLICGHTDYETVGEKVIGLLEQEIGQKAG